MKPILVMLEEFIVKLFNQHEEDIVDIKSLFHLPVKFGGMGIVDPTQEKIIPYEISSLGTSHLMDELIGKVDFIHGLHKNKMSNTKDKTKELKMKEYNVILEDILKNIDDRKRRVIERGGATGRWLIMIPMWINGTGLSSLEFRDALNMRYNLTPKDFPKFCDGCGELFPVDHALQCKKGGNIGNRHNEVRDEVGIHASAASNPSSVHN